MPGEIAPGTLTLTSAPHPFRVERSTVRMPEGLTLAQMLDLAQPDPVLARHAVACINGHIIPRENWTRIRPRAGAHVDIRVVPRGGGGGKDIFRIVLMIAVVAASFFLGPVVGPALFGTAGFLGITGAQLGSALIGLIGMLAINVIAPVRPPTLGGGKTDKETLTIEGARNQGRPFQPVPVVLGRIRTAPAYGSSPYTEVIGGKHYLRLLFVWGVGPLAIDESSLKIGDTALSEFEGVEIEHREGYADDAPLTLYNNAVLQEDLSIKLTAATGWVVRNTTPIADEISFDISFPQGLFQIDEAGHRAPEVVRIEVEYRAVGATDWEVPSYTAKTTPAGWVTGSEIKFTYKKTAATRDGFRFTVPARGEYQVRIRRTEPDHNDTYKGMDDTYWTALRTITNEDPIQSAVPVAKTAMRIMATDQLNRVVDEFTGVVTAKGRNWVPGDTWDDFLDVDAVADIDASAGYWEDDVEITNPASLFLHVMQGRGMAEPLVDDRIDLTGLGDFHEFCAAKGFTFNQVRDFQTSVWDTLADVAAAGRAAPIQVDGKWSVVIERPQDLPVSHVTQFNSFGFSAEKMWPDLPHAWRVRFSNEAEDWRTDEYRVYRDGYDRSNATKFESLDLPGVTNPEQVYKLGRFRLAQGRLQAERWNFSQDMEVLAYRRGDRILITHDVLLIGLAAGRIKAVEVDGDNQVVAVTLTETVTMEAAKSYGLSIRNVANVAVTGQVVTVEGDATTLTFTSPIASVGAEPAVAAGDIFGFGLLDQETEDASVIDIQPDTDLRARVTAVPYRAAAFDIDTDEIPEFETNLTPLPAIPAPTIEGIVTDETVLGRGPGDSLITRMVISFAPVSDPRFASPSIEVQGRPTETGEPWRAMQVSQEAPHRIFISDVDSGDLWDIRVRYKMDGLLLPGPWAYRYNVLVVGMSTPPQGLQGLTLSAIGGTAYLRWDLPPELDVRVGGRIQFRHSQEFDGATWASSASIGTVALANSLFAVLPLKPGTYLARVFDAIGTPSADIATISTKQATILGFADLDSLDEAPTFPGTHDNTIVVDSSLRIAAAGLFDDIPDLDDEFSVDELGPPGLSGEYVFAAGFDFGSVTRVRLTTRIAMTSFAVNDLIDNRTDPIDAWEDIDGSAQAAGDIVIYVSHTDDDPAGPSPVWSAWNRLDSAEFEARGFRFYAALSTADAAFNVAVTELGIDAEELA